jgi:hypothetical protein
MVTLDKTHQMQASNNLNPNNPTVVIMRPLDPGCTFVSQGRGNTGSCQAWKANVAVGDPVNRAALTSGPVNDNVRGVPCNRYDGLLSGKPYSVWFHSAKQILVQIYSKDAEDLGLEKGLQWFTNWNTTIDQKAFTVLPDQKSCKGTCFTNGTALGVKLN